MSPSCQFWRAIGVSTSFSLVERTMQLRGFSPNPKRQKKITKSAATELPRRLSGYWLAVVQTRKLDERVVSLWGLYQFPPALAGGQSLSVPWALAQKLFLITILTF